MRYLCLLVFFVFCLNGKSQQNYFNISIYTHGSEKACGVIEVDSFYLVYGHKVDTSVGYQGVFIYKLNRQGVLVDEKFYGCLGMIYTRPLSKGFIQINDTSFALVTTVFDSIFIGGNRRIFSKLMLLDKNLDTTQTLNFYDTISPSPDSYLYFDDVLVTPDKGFIILGAIRTDTIQNTNSILLKLDSNGVMEWQKQYGGNVLNLIPTSLVITPDSGFCVGAIINKANGTVNGYVFKTDKYGTKKWHKELGGQWHDYVYSIFLARDSSILVTVSDIYDDHPNVNYPYRRISLLSANYKNGAVNWTKQWYHGNSLTPRSIVQSEDGSILIAGDVYFVDTTLLSSGMHGSLLKLDEYGDSLWFRHYSYHPLSHNYLDQYFYDVIPTSDNGYIMVGESKQVNPVWIGPGAWIVKVDSLGCDTPGCHTAGIMQMWQEDYNIEIYPNPADQFLNIQIQPNSNPTVLSIYNTMGYRVEQFEINAHLDKIKLNISDLTPGIYLIQLESKDQNIGSSKFIKL